MIYCHLTRDKKDGNDTNAQGYFEEAIGKARDEYESKTGKDKNSKELFNELTDEIITTDGYTGMIKKLITKKLDQVHRIIVLLPVNSIDCCIRYNNTI